MTWPKGGSTVAQAIMLPPPRSAVALALLVAGLIFSLPIRHDVVIFDEGLMLDGSVRVAQGEIPYRDFWTMYAPASFYLVAGAFHVLPVTMLTMRGIWVAFETLVAVETLALAWALAGWRAGWLAFGLTLAFTTTTHPNYGYPAIPALAGALAVVLVSATRDWPFLVGVLISCTALFRQDFALYVTLACLPELFARIYQAPRSGLVNLGKILLGGGAVLLPAAAVLLRQAGHSAPLEQLFHFPVTTLPQYARVSLSAGLWIPLTLYRQHPDVPVKLLALAISVGLAIAVLILLIRMLREHHVPRSSPQRLALTLALLSLALANHARFRFDATHVWPMLIGASALFASAALFLQNAPLRRLGIAVVSGVFIAMAALGADHIRTQIRSATAPFASTRAGGVFVPADFANYNMVLEAVRANTRPGEYIFSGATRHDRIHVNDALIYFLSDRRIPVPYHELNRGMIVTRPVQAEIISALESRHVRLLVLLELDSHEPNLSAVSSGVDLLDNYIRARFEQRAGFGSHQIWLRR